MKNTLSLVLIILIIIPVFCYIITENEESSPVILSQRELTQEHHEIVEKLQISAKSCVLMDGKTGEVLYGKNEKALLPMASTTKIMTAIIAIEKLKLDSIAKIRFQDINIEGSNIYIKEEDKLTIKDLLYGLLLESGNDCANVLAYNVAGGKEEFAKLMNEKAGEIGLENTKFQNPSGLHHEEHYTTAKDMAKIMIYAMKNPVFREITACKKMKLSDGKIADNHNKLLDMTDYCTGGKTGFTKKAGRCLVSSGAKNGSEYVVVTLNAPDDWDDHIKLYEYGFSNFHPVILCTDEKIEIDVVGGKEESCTLKNEKNIITRNSKIKNGYKKRVILNRFLYAPLKKGDAVGKIEFYNENGVIDFTNLVIEKDIEKSKRGIFKWLK
ncbi:MAG: D-alanyl-D-alanine carboxypeptidase [Clostridia bacterium]|nr:D-alanyl-D-alanine carboxypeptidase [Clostridia bacterium]